jgi:hypothetical protein
MVGDDRRSRPYTILIYSMMTITEVHYDIAATKILGCKNTTSYSVEALDNMVESSNYILDTLTEINNTTVKTKNNIDKDIELDIHIDNIKFYHNMLVVYSENRMVLDYVKEHLHDAVRMYNLKLDNFEKLYDIKATGNGFGDALVINYDSCMFKKYVE